MRIRRPSRTWSITRSGAFSICSVSTMRKLRAAGTVLPTNSAAAPRVRSNVMNQRETAFADINARVADNGTRDASTPRRHIGRSMQRLEDPAILTGRGRYGDDIAVKPGTLHAAILRSPHAHAEILSIDTQAAAKVAGVRAVLTRDDLRAWSRPFVVGVKSPMEQWALAMDRVRYVGEPVAVVMAESRALAEDALDLIKVDYAMLDPVTAIEQSL